MIIGKDLYLKNMIPYKKEYNKLNYLSKQNWITTIDIVLLTCLKIISFIYFMIKCQKSILFGK
jgi:hypothetical protein